MSIIFNSIYDIKNSILSNVKKYIIDNDIKNINDFSKNIYPLIKGYLRELKKINEIIDFDIIRDIKNSNIDIILFKNEDSLKFKINIYDELRKMKILKIKNQEK